MNRQTEYILRGGLVFAFLYPAISSLITPSDWVGFVPMFVRDVVDGNIFLFAFAVIQIPVALGILFFRNPFYPALLGSIILVLVILFNFGSFVLIFRDVSILAMALALMSAHLGRKNY